MTPYQRLQPFFDAYNSKITDARNEHHMSLNDLSVPFGHSGIPPYSVALELVDGFEPPTC